MQSLDDLINLVGTKKTASPVASSPPLRETPSAPAVRSAPIPKPKPKAQPRVAGARRRQEHRHAELQAAAERAKSMLGRWEQRSGGMALLRPAGPC